MEDPIYLVYPVAYDAIQHDTAQLGFQMACEPNTGSLLRTLATSKPGGQFLEIGTGTGIGTSWLLDGMDQASTLTTIDRDPQVAAVAQRHLSHDSRVIFTITDADLYLKTLPPARFDFIFADAFPGKFYLLDEVLKSLKPGGFYVIDDLLPQATWPENHQSNVDRLIDQLQTRADLRITELEWASGIIIAVKLS